MQSHQLGLALDALSSPLTILDKSGVIVYVNQAWKRFADANGLTMANDGLGCNYLEYCEDAEIDPGFEPILVAQGIKSVISREKAEFHCQYPCHSPTEKRWFQMRVAPFDYDGRQHVIVIHENITDSKASENRLKNILENAPIGMAIVSLEGRFIEVNQALADILGYEKSELLELGCAQINHPEDLHLDEAMMQALLQGKQSSYRIEKRFLRKNGHIVWADLTYSILRDEIGAPIYIIKQMQNITERVEAEICLRNSEQLSQMLLNISIDGFNFTDLHGRFLDANSSFCLMLGYTKAEILNMTIYDIEATENSEQITVRLKKIMLNGFDRFETIQRRKDDTLLDVEVSVAYLSDKNQFFAFIRDITQRKQSEKLRIRQLEQQRDALVREVHHRIKNHLQGMVGLLNLYLCNQPGEKELIQDIAAKITSIAAVYGIQGKSNQKSAYLCDITFEICNSLEIFGMEHSNIKYSGINHHNILLPSEYAVPLALIINELIVNAIKHNSDPTPKNIEVILAVNENTAILTINNNCQKQYAFPDFEHGIGQGVGLSLVRAMLPKNGACLTLTQQADLVSAQLTLTTPVISITQDPLACSCQTLSV